MLENCIPVSISTIDLVSYGVDICVMWCASVAYIIHAIVLWINDWIFYIFSCYYLMIHLSASVIIV